MSLTAVLKKSGQVIASHDVPLHSKDLPGLSESMRILSEEVNQTLTSIIMGVESNSNDAGDDDIEEDSEEDDSAAVNGSKRKTEDEKPNKRLKTS